ncbi:MAG: type II toxin-antitoxin system RelE/ParE family toxin [Algoriphagus sp.]|uniref:type II toxin-antitoxin system RelE/ParE family toxin n=1 Tax=Algoriphagus sp. TaxID=1872435 RepID=UPI002731EDAD|nr:type II toxin-antitoxin system RelE/ParE family toxin [Algoriphagus sp.]MDP2041024.1 type II toxin-antitoxin system RelE/ParE family toxin [Algoriphagus sp.]MDP3473437.1 type II toxin-antitoxin system RelE/ParE family toxin [Algoriphagus sp.]
MGRRKLISSHLAKIKLFKILDFYTHRNKSSTYSKKLYREFNKTLIVVSKNPQMGIKTDLDSVRGVIVRDFILFYELTPEKIIVHTVWDTRQNPDDLKII